MQNTITYSEAPFGYMICLNRKCGQAKTCLRQLIEPVVPATIRQFPIINPNHLATLEGECPYFRPAVKVRYAKGFIGILDNMPYLKMQKAVSFLTGLFGKRTYFRVRKGERLLSPAEQEEVLRIIQNCGVPDPGDFDAYIEQYNW